MSFLFTPLEQFDQVTWLSHRVVETLEPYVLFISENEFDASSLYVNTYGSASSSISFVNLRQSESQLRIRLVALGLFSHFAPLTLKQQLFSVSEGFAHLFFLAAINIFTGAFLAI